MNISNNYVVIDIETCPIDLSNYNELSDSDKLKLLNPIDSRIVAIGVRFKSQNIIINNLDERLLIENFWNILTNIVNNIESSLEIIGFNINSFDLPFIISKSFVYNVKILPFKMNEIIDIRDKINCYKYGSVKGKMKEYAKLIGMNILDVSGSNVATLYMNHEYDKISEYLEHDLLITDTLYQRCIDTNIIHITRW